MNIFRTPSGSKRDLKKRTRTSEVDRLGKVDESKLGTRSGSYKKN